MYNSENLSRLTYLAVKVQQTNPTALIGGSLALHLQGIDIGREPVDLDIILVDSTKQLRYPGLSVTDLYDFNTEYGELYDIKGYNVKSHELEGFKVDVFTPASKTPTPETVYVPVYTESNGFGKPIHVLVPQALSILSAKLSYALRGGPSSDKHCIDISKAMMSLRIKNGFDI